MNPKDELRVCLERLRRIQNRTKDAGRDYTNEEMEEIKTLLDRIDQLERIIDLDDRIGKVKPRPEPVSTYVPQKEERFETFGEQMLAIINASIPGKPKDPRLYRATGLSEGAPSEGGFLVQEDFAQGIIYKALDTGIVASRVTKMRINQRSNVFHAKAFDETTRVTGSRLGGVQMYWQSEADEKTAKAPKFRELNLPLYKITGLCYLTDELMQDADALDSWLNLAFRDELAFMLDDAIINGTGAGMPVGVVNSLSTIIASKVAEQAATTIVWENIADMWERLLPSAKPNAIWLINENIEDELIQMWVGDVTATQSWGGPVWSANGPMMIMGRPIIPIEHCASLGVKGDIILGDFSRYLLVDKGTAKANFSIHVKFEYDEQAFRLVYRCNGQPMLNRPLTPYKGVITQSDFVVLQARA